jgi:hypothetical protein
LVKNPDNYGERVVTFTGRMVNFVQDSVGLTTAMSMSAPNDVKSIIYVLLSPSVDLVQLNQGDTVTVWGQSEGSFSGTGALGTLGAHY